MRYALFFLFSPMALKIALRSVETVMGRLVHEFEVFKSIVELILVLVVDNFMSIKDSAKRRFNYQTMFCHIPIVCVGMRRHPYKSVTVGNNDSALPMRRFFSEAGFKNNALAFFGADKIFGWFAGARVFELVRFTVKFLTTNSTRDIFTCPAFMKYTHVLSISEIA
jgi:hypothetical protein